MTNLNPPPLQVTDLDLLKARFRYALDQLEMRVYDVYFHHGESKEIIDAFLENLPECGQDTQDWLESITPNWQILEGALSEPHLGDCTACPMTCVRCTVERFFGDTTVSWSKAEGYDALMNELESENPSE